MDEAGQLHEVAHLLRKVGSVVEVRVDGPSMFPALPPGSNVRIRCGGLDEIGPGDAVAFLAGGRRLTIHRLVEAPTGTPFVITRGDANIFCDPPIPTGDVVGRVVGRSQPTGEGCEAGSVEESWEPVPAPRRRSGFSGMLAGANARLTSGALRLHVRLAQAVSLASLALILPRAIVQRGRPRGRPPILGMLSLRRPPAGRSSEAH